MAQFGILFEDEDILVLDKPSGVTVNRSDTTKNEETVQDFVEKHLGLSPYKGQPVREGEFKSNSEVFKERSGIVHRLDKETSGALLVAKNLKSFEELQRQFKERITKKSYLALAHGNLLPQIGEINVPVGRLEFNRKRFGVVAGGRESITKYIVQQVYQNTKTKELFSLTQLFPLTGRTHQIRVHLKHLNHPIFGDELYAGRKTARNDRKLLQRFFLHAASISFIHPGTNKEMEIASTLPQELQDLLSTLQKS